MRIAIVLFSAMLLSSCGASVPHAHVACTSGWRNDTDGVLSDADLATAWAHAQQTIASGNWVINALSCRDINIPCRFEPANPKALAMTPDCFGVKGVHGTVYGGNYGVTDDSRDIAIDIDLGHDKAWALASYEMENALGERLGFPMGDR